MGLVSKTTKAPSVGHTQTQEQTSTVQSIATKTGSQNQTSDSTRESKATSTSNSTKTTTQTQITQGSRRTNSENTLAKTSVEKANIGFELSFSIPLVGVIPASGGQC
jgi:hypothetical protein